jgi:hypothetical protein
MNIPLMEFAQATADANGRAVAEAAPEKFGDSWEVTLISTNTNSTSESQLRVYRGVESASALLLSTYSANNDNASGGAAINVGAGDKLVFVWSGASSGSICTARIEGTLKSGRR